VAGFKEFLIAVLGTLGSLPWSQAFECPSVKPSEKAPSYQRSSEPTRCEGFFQQEIAGPYLELVSLISASSKAGAEGQALRLHASGTSTRLVVHPLPQGIAYRVDLANVAGGVSWQAQAMLKATNLKIRDLGFLALAPTATDRLDVFPTSIGHPSSEGGVVALIRTSVQTQEMRWRKLYPSKAEGSTANWQKLPFDSIEKWGVAAIDLSISKEDQFPMLVQVQARRANGEVLPVLEFRVVSQ
jgi:hypothetical protein